MTSAAPRSPAPAPSSTPGAGVRPPASVRWALLGVMLAMLLSMLDNTVVGTAMPTIVGDVGGLEHLSWVVSAYMLATAVTTPVWGKFGDLFGRKSMYLISIAVFLVGSALSGAAQNMAELIGFRIVQGIGAGGIGAGAFALIGTVVPPRLRGSYQGMSAAVMAIGTVGGPLIGGFVTDQLGWRWIFYLNIPLGIVALVWCWKLLAVPHQRRATVIDWLGIALLGVLVTALVLGATWAGTTYAWGSWQVLGCAVVAIATLAALIAWERRFPEPVLPLEIFAHRNFRIAAVMIFAGGAAMFGATLYLPLFQQTVQGATATSSGLLLLPLMAGNLLVSQAVGSIMSRTGRYKVFPVLGTALLTTALGLFATMGTGTPFWLTSAYMLVAGIGLGCLLQMSTTIAQNSVDLKHMGTASASVNLFRTLGGSIGVAVFGSLFTRAVTAHAGSATSGAPYLAGVAAGTGQLFLVGALICAAAFAVSLFLVEEPLEERPMGPQGTD
ncbi:MAG TPA: MDR family MFS transporter [Cellulomonas sp.]